MADSATSSLVEKLRTNPEVRPAPLAHQAIHDTVVRILDDQPRGALLDVPAGEGALAGRLIDAGFEVRCCDLYPEIFRLDGVDIHQGNLDAELPFGDQSFDYVTCLEGLEHIENPQQAMREFARVLKPGGKLFVSTPFAFPVHQKPYDYYRYTAYGLRLLIERHHVRLRGCVAILDLLQEHFAGLEVLRDSRLDLSW